MQPLLGGRYGRFDLLGALALLARRPIQTAQAVQNRAADLVFGVGFEFDVVAWIEAVDGRDQPERSGGNQVVQIHAFRQPLVNSPGDQSDLRQMLENQAFALLAAMIVRLVSLKPASRLFAVALVVMRPPFRICDSRGRIRSQNQIQDGLRVAGSRSSGNALAAGEERDRFSHAHDSGSGSGPKVSVSSSRVKSSLRGSKMRTARPPVSNRWFASRPEEPGACRCRDSSARNRAKLFEGIHFAARKSRSVDQDQIFGPVMLRALAPMRPSSREPGSRFPEWPHRIATPRPPRSDTCRASGFAAACAR